MTGAENFMKKRKCKNNHCSSMSNSAWCDLNSKGDIMKLHDRSPNPKGNFQKTINCTPHQYMPEGESMKSKLQKIFRRTKKAWDSFIKPGLKLATPLTSAAVAAKTKNPESTQIASNFLKSLRGGTILSLFDMQEHGLRWKAT